MKIKKLLGALSLAIVTAIGGFALISNNKSSKAEPASADYSSTIRVYLDFNTSGWGTITDIRLGGNGSGDGVVATSSNAKYNQSLGNYVRDISSSSVYDKMGCFFKENGTQWLYQYDNGYIWIDDSKFAPGYEFQIKGIGWVADSGDKKYFKAEVYRIGAITDNVSNPTVYFVDGYSWHSNSHVYYWGGTASTSWPGQTMVDSKLRIKAYVGETEYSGLHIYKYTISGSVAYLKFNNNSSETGALRPVNNGVYFYGVDGKYEPVVRLLISLKSNMGSYTYNGRSFSDSICHLSQSQAGTFINSYNTLAASSDAQIASSVPGSAVVTYSQPETSTSATAEISLQDIRDSLARKYPSLSSSGRAITNIVNNETTSSIAIVIVVSVVSITAIGGYFFLRRRKEN